MAAYYWFMIKKSPTGRLPVNQDWLQSGSKSCKKMGLPLPFPFLSLAFGIDGHLSQIRVIVTVIVGSCKSAG